MTVNKIVMRACFVVDKKKANWMLIAYPSLNLNKETAHFIKNKIYVNIMLKGTIKLPLDHHQLQITFTLTMIQLC